MENKYSKWIPQYPNCTTPKDNLECTCISTEPKVTMKLYRKYHYGDNFKQFTPTLSQKRKAKLIYNKLIKLEPNEKLKLNTKKYKDLEKLINIIDVRYFPYYDLEWEQIDDGEVITYLIKGKRVQKAIFQNKKIKKLVMETIEDIGIVKGKTTIHDAIILINNYFNMNYKYLDYGYFDIGTYDKLLIYKKSGICQDYAYAFYLLASYCGITVAQCYCEESDMSHAFNAVKINNKVTYVDTCWNIAGDNKYLFMQKKDFETAKYHRVDTIIWG